MTKSEHFAFAIIVILFFTFGWLPAHADVQLGPPIFDDEWDLNIDSPIPPPGPELCVDRYTGDVVECREVNFGIIEV
jgi:hypothetical protein